MDTDRFRVRPGQKVDLRRYDTADTAPFKHKQKTLDRLERSLERMVALQDVLYADNRWSMLLIFQAMDAAGKDSTIKHVMSGVNPQGCQVYSFKAPTAAELDHDFLWRSTLCLPERGRIGIFNRSYYEETLVVRVHRDILDKEKLPAELITKRIWKDSFEDINAFERYLTRNGTAILKFFLYVSKDEQKRRFLERLQDPAKLWKFSAADLRERDCFGDYMKAYQETIHHTATPEAPWFVVPADHKWFTRLVVADAVVDALERLDLAFPRVSKTQRRELRTVQRTLEQQG
jgi:PPK2 family polyphosphate:nucleotide phosphotransferase